MKAQKLEIVISVKMVTDISWFDAIKLRLSGGQAIREFIESKVIEANEIEEKGE